MEEATNPIPTITVVDEATNPRPPQNTATDKAKIPPSPQALHPRDATEPTQIDRNDRAQPCEPCGRWPWLHVEATTLRKTVPKRKDCRQPGQPSKHRRSRVKDSLLAPKRGRTSAKLNQATPIRVRTAMVYSHAPLLRSTTYGYYLKSLTGKRADLRAINSSPANLHRTRIQYSGVGHRSTAEARSSEDSHWLCKSPPFPLFISVRNTVPFLCRGGYHITFPVEANSECSDGLASCTAMPLMSQLKAFLDVLRNLGSLESVGFRPSCPNLHHAKAMCCRVKLSMSILLSCSLIVKS